MVALLSLLGLAFTGLGLLFTEDGSEDDSAEPAAPAEPEAGGRDLVSGAPLGGASEAPTAGDTASQQPAEEKPAQDILPALPTDEGQSPTAPEASTGSPPGSPTILPPDVAPSDAPSPAHQAQPSAAGENHNKIFGTDGKDSLFGTEGDDWMSAGDGDDRLFGGADDDVLIGGAGNDMLLGGKGNDKLFGGAGDDYLHGGGGDDLLHGGPGDDELIGGAGDDVIYGGDGNDKISGGPGRDTMYGGAGDDVISGVERGEQAPDLIYGGPGNDTLIGGDGDRLEGGEGEDTFVVQTKHGAVKIADFDPEFDNIQIVYVGLDQPELTKLVHDDGTTVLADGRPVAELQGRDDVDLSKITFIQH